MLVKTLKAHGHTSEEAEDGLVAFGMVKEKGFTVYDAILMDFVMVCMYVFFSHSNTLSRTLPFPTLPSPLSTHAHICHIFNSISPLSLSSLFSRWWMDLMLPKSFETWVIKVLSLVVQAIPWTQICYDSKKVVVIVSLASRSCLNSFINLWLSSQGVQPPPLVPTFLTLRCLIAAPTWLAALLRCYSRQVIWPNRFKFGFMGTVFRLVLRLTYGCGCLVILYYICIYCIFTHWWWLLWVVATTSVGYRKGLERLFSYVLHWLDLTIIIIVCR